MPARCRTALSAPWRRGGIAALLLALTAWPAAGLGQEPPPDDAPAAVDDSYTSREDAPKAFPVRRNDTDIDGGPMRVVSVTDGSHGTVAITNNGARLTYTPDPDYCNPHATLPLDTFTYTLNGGSEATVSVWVRCAG